MRYDGGMANVGHECDLVMEGGGVRGVGLVGAVSVLTEHGYVPRRVGGTSAGAIVGSLVAAGMAPDKLQALMSGLDYTKFRDKSWLDSLGLPGKVASLVLTKGIYRGEFLRMWLDAQLKALGVQTFGDLKLTEDWAKDLPPEKRYRLVVIVSDVTRGRMVRLPWDYAAYDLDPDKQRVADAVRASMSLPFFYQPARLKGSLCVDGGLLSNFPIDLFDDTPDRPTFGIKLSAKPTAPTMNPTHNTYEFARSIVSTTVGGHDQMHLDDPATLARTMFVDTTGVPVTDFDITAAQQDMLYQNGRKGAEKFLAGLPAQPA